MIGQQSPCIATGLCCLQNIPKPIKKITPVLIVIENPSSGDPSNDYVMQCPWGIYACFSWHIFSVQKEILTSQINVKPGFRVSGHIGRKL